MTSKNINSKAKLIKCTFYHAGGEPFENLWGKINVDDESIKLKDLDGIIKVKKTFTEIEFDGFCTFLTVFDPQGYEYVDLPEEFIAFLNSDEMYNRGTKYSCYVKCDTFDEKVFVKFDHLDFLKGVDYGVSIMEFSKVTISKLKKLENVLHLDSNNYKHLNGKVFVDR
jgi:hypothetical protein